MGGRVLVLHMDALAQVETGVERLLARLEKLKTENESLVAEISGLKRENGELVAANRELKNIHLRDNALRMEALRRVEALLRKIQDYGVVD